VAVRAQANSVTVEEIDQCLLRIAAFNTSSSLAVQSLASTWKDADQLVLLENLYQRLQGREAKWLTRLILKSYSPIKFPEKLEPGPQHSFLPNCVQLKIQFPSSAPAPMRRDGTKMIAGVGSVEAATHPPTPPRTVSQPASSAPRPVSTANHVSPTLSFSNTRLPASLPRPTPALNHIQLTPPTSSSPAAPVAGPSSQHRPPTPSRAVLSPISHNILTSSPQKLPKTTRPSPSPSILIGGIGTCQIASHICPLSTCVFLLAPCISSVPYITENLLHSHGCRYFTSIPALAHPSLRQRCSRTGKRFRKIILVESYRTQPTVDFLKRVGRLGLMKKGKKEWVEVYDWRLLESIAKVDRGKALTFDPWDRSWIGAV
jgi:DNA ligase N terminus